jgi:hypothetical protein
MSNKGDTFVDHYVGANLKTSASKYSYNTVQGHLHSVYGTEYSADKKMLTWAMGTGCLINQKLSAFAYGRPSHARPILGVGATIGTDGDTLYISDLHIPYHHPQAFDFLYELNHIYKFDRIVSVGDVYDHHQASFHPSEPDALNAEDEYQESKRYARELQQIFPKMDITPGNHCRIPQRKAKEVGLPISMLSDFNKLYGTKRGWRWHEDGLWLNVRRSRPVNFAMTLTSKGEWDGDIPRPNL